MAKVVTRAITKQVITKSLPAVAIVAAAVEDARGTLVSADAEGSGASSGCAAVLSMKLSTAAELEDHVLVFSQS